MFYFWLGAESDRIARKRDIAWQLARGITPTASMAEYMAAMLPERHDIEADGFITVYPKVK